MALPEAFNLKTADGEIEIPSVCFGTWAFGDTGWCYEATREALKAGYRHLYCAWNYGISIPRLESNMGLLRLTLISDR